MKDGIKPVSERQDREAADLPTGQPSPSAQSLKLYSTPFPSSRPGKPCSPLPTTPPARTTRSHPPGEGPAQSPLLPPSPALATSHLQLSPGSQSPQSQAFGAPGLKLPMLPGFVRPRGGSSCPGQLPRLQRDHGNPAGSPRGASRPPQRGREQPGPGEREGEARTERRNQRETADKEPPDKARWREAAREKAAPARCAKAQAGPSALAEPGGPRQEGLAASGRRDIRIGWQRSFGGLLSF